MPDMMLAVVKPKAAPGAEIREVKVPGFGRTDVLVKVKVASICGTDLHIYEWDRWAQNRIHPPLIPGHEFCGEVVAYGDEVTSVKEGDFVSAEMHVACGKCLQCRTGEAHICQNVKIIGVDADGAFAEYVVIPESNIWKLDPAIPQEYASILDPLGNAVHTVRRGGRISLLGLTSRPISLNFSEDIIFKGITIQGINGRRMYQTWYQMTALLKAGKLDLHPVITDRIAMKDFSKGMERLKTGEASKILVYPNGAK